MHSAVAHHLGSCLTVFQDDKLLRQVGTLNRPNAIAEVHGTQGSLLALAEGHQVQKATATAGQRGCLHIIMDLSKRTKPSVWQKVPVILQLC